VTRRELRELALIRLKEARVLLRNGYYDGAYYLSGYCIECALKACIAKRTRRYEFPDKKTADASHTDKLSDLIKVAQLEDAHIEEVGRDVVFGANWNIVKEWSEQSRYKKHLSKSAEDILSAVADRRHGVLRWIKQRW
jgi:HEPN domain-containing protein